MLNKSLAAFCFKKTVWLGEREMLYEKNARKELSKELFKNPTCEYRAAPFWAWNGRLTSELLLEEIGYLKEMGMGGYHIHVRTGMETKYLSEEYMTLVRNCLEKGKEEKMLTWLYDEDRWPSGAAGGYVTKDEKYRARHLLFTNKPYGSEDQTNHSAEDASARAVRTGNGQLLACYDILLNEDGSLKEYRKIGTNDPVEGMKWYAYLEMSAPNPWYNNQTYVNTLDKKAIERFIEITHESYKQNFGNEFGKSIPAIFTDEPQFSHKTTLASATMVNDVTFPWTDDLPDTFSAAYGEDIMAELPQLFWDLPDGKVSLVRYHYHDHIAERFASAFADTCGSWCRQNGIKLTGHMMKEPTLCSQTVALGEAMRSYRSFDLPGIDMLCARFEYTTAKQAQSAVHQYGYEGMLSELYGVTGWDFDFRGHKLHGDWQAALGVTIRVHHLSWVCMAGEAKRDFPASINYQSPWFREYPIIEDHFARVNTAMTRGKPVVKVGVIHPIESYWLHWGPSEQTSLIREQLDENFKNITEWLLFGSVDFDFICESLLPSQCKTGSNPLRVGEMEYDAVIVPGCETLRYSTVQRLNEFRRQGGKLIFMGSVPTLMDASENSEPAKLAAESEVIPFSRAAILKSLESLRLLDIRNIDGTYTKNLLHQLRRDGDKLWLFIAHGTEPYNKDVVNKQSLIINLKGIYTPLLYNTMTGETNPLDCFYKKNATVILCEIYDYDSLLIQFTPKENPSVNASSTSIAKIQEEKKKIHIADRVPITLCEPNVLLLDMGEYSLDGEPFNSVEELLIADNICRKKLGWPSRKRAVAQPWAIEQEEITHSVNLRFIFKSEEKVCGCKLAIEDAESVTIRFNGVEVKSEVTGWYVDKSIKTVALPPILKGNNILEISLPFGRRTNIEWCYILGDFGVRVSGCEKVITEPVRSLTFADIVPQGLPFYGGNIIYRVDFNTSAGRLVLEAAHFRGALISASLDGEQFGKIFVPPYICEKSDVSAGRHTLDITVFGNRYNTFGQVHLFDSAYRWFGPNSWRTTGSRWSYEYQLKSTGLLSAPNVYLK